MSDHKIHLFSIIWLKKYKQEIRGYPLSVNVIGLIKQISTLLEEKGLTGFYEFTWD